MGDQLYLERFVWFDHEARKERFPNANKLGAHFEIAPKTAQCSIDHFRNRLQAPFEYDKSQKVITTPPLLFQIQVFRISEEKILAFLNTRKLITEASDGFLGEASGWTSS